MLYKHTNPIFTSSSTILLNAAVVVVISVLSGCASNEKPCEEVLEVKQQHQECERLRKTMGKTNYPQQALTAKLQYEEVCLNLRYYRDEYDTICKKDGIPIGAESKSKKDKKSN